ncbi:MAG: hypothetical protein JWL68_1508 [Actinomycetia bacterium]|nr:hypothetical protein [Actinomycetes bacterium]
MRAVLRAVATAGLTVTALAFPALAFPALLIPAAPAVASSSPVDISPSPSAPGTSTTFSVNCSSLSAGGNATSATLIGTTLGLSGHIPMQASTHTNEFVTTVVLPATIRPGTYQPDIDCSNGVTASAAFTVKAVPGVAPATGDGTTATATDGPLTAIGLALLGLGAVSGALVLTRRRFRSRA